MKPRGLLPRMLVWCDRHPRKAAFLLSLALHVNSRATASTPPRFPVISASRRGGASSPSTRLVSIRRGRGWFLFRIRKCSTVSSVNTMLHAGDLQQRRRKWTGPEPRLLGPAHGRAGLAQKLRPPTRSLLRLPARHGYSPWGTTFVNVLYVHACSCSLMLSVARNARKDEMSARLLR